MTHLRVYTQRRPRRLDGPCQKDRKAHPGRRKPTEHPYQKQVLSHRPRPREHNGSSWYPFWYELGARGGNILLLILLLFLPPPSSAETFDLSVCPCVRVSVCPCVRVSVCPCVRVSVCLSGPGCFCVHRLRTLAMLPSPLCSRLRVNENCFDKRQCFRGSDAQSASVRHTNSLKMHLVREGAT